MGKNSKKPVQKRLAIIYTYKADPHTSFRIEIPDSLLKQGNPTLNFEEILSLLEKNT